MLKKNYTKTGQFCRVTFKVLPDVDARKVVLCGDFNDWNKNEVKQDVQNHISPVTTV